MKAHLIIKLFQPLDNASIPHWIDFIQDKRNSFTQFANPIDKVFEKYNLDFWITKEYRPDQGNLYSVDEIKNGLDKIYRVILQQEGDLPGQLIENIKYLPEVADARPAIISEAELPKPSLSQSLSSVFDIPRNNIYLKEAQLYSKGNPEVKIAILDTGIDLQHPELQNIIYKKADFVNLEGLDTSSFIGDILGYDEDPTDEVGHGTHVAGIIAARGLKMPEGIVPQCKLMAVRVLATMKQGEKRFGAGLLDNINTAIKWAVDNEADIINMSLGIKHEYGGLPHEEVINYAIGKGVTIVAASGNDGTNDKYYPGALPGVLAVGAVDDQDNIAPFSTYGAHVSLVAPGTNIYSSYLNQTYALSSGTSQAAPFVSGAVALLKSFALQNGYKLKDSQIKYILKHTSDKPDSQYKTEKGGYGRLNLIDALKLLKYQTSN